eukprot:1541352-Prymnesium_polylepis.1
MASTCAASHCGSISAAFSSFEAIALYAASTLLPSERRRSSFWTSVGSLPLLAMHCRMKGSEGRGDRGRGGGGDDGSGGEGGGGGGGGGRGGGDRCVAKSSLSCRSEQVERAQR